MLSSSGFLSVFFVFPFLLKGEKGEADRRKGDEDARRGDEEEEEELEACRGPGCFEEERRLLSDTEVFFEGEKEEEEEEEEKRSEG